MRLMARLSLLLLFPLLVRAATIGNIALEPANHGLPTLQKTLSSTSETDFSFKTEGVTISNVATDNANAYQSIEIMSQSPEKFGSSDQLGHPELPLYSQLVAIPDRAGISVEIINAEYQTISDIDIMPCQISQENENDEHPFTKDESIYQQDKFLPEQPVVLGEPIICRDLRMIQSVVYPVQYNPVRRELRVYTSIDYRLNYTGEDSRNRKIRRNNKISESFLPMYRALVPNADEMLSSYEPVRGGYLIITPNIIPDSLVNVLARWKHLKGYSVVIAKATDIDPDGDLAAVQVYNYIQNAYQTWETPPEYVCIIGDVDLQIPDYGFDGYVSDHPYSLLEGDDLFSDIMVTRMSVPATLSTIRTTIYKPVIYEKNPFMGDPNYWLRGLSGAANLTYGGAPSRTPRLTTLWVRQELMSHGFIRVDTTFAWDNYDPGVEYAVASLNNGVSMISYRGNGTPSSWGGPWLSVDDLEGLNLNNKMGIMASLTCGNGRYGESECFGEKWIRMGVLPNLLKGGPAFYGATESGTHTKYDNPIMIGYYWGILEEGVYNFTNAAFLGKAEMYNTFPREHVSGTLVERFFYTFNTLGEPELELRTAIPQTMTVTYPSTLPVGSSIITIHVNGSGGGPLANAYVNLVKGYGANEEVFVGGRTNANGDITLDFSATTADTMFVTVTARNYIPHVGNTLVQSQAVAVNVGAVAMDDDNSGNSSGNSDGNINPGETIELNVTLRNFGNSTTATNVQATLVSSDPAITITVPNQAYGSIAPGGTAVSAGFAAHLASDIPHGEHYILQLNITSDQGSWTGGIPLDIKNMLFAVNSVAYPGNFDNILDPGESSNLVVTLQNQGELAGTALTGTLTCTDTSVVIIDGSASFGNIAIGGSGSNTASPFVVSVGQNVYNGRNINFNLSLASSNGSVATKAFSVIAGTVNTYDPIGPDNYGYYLYDNTDASYSQAPYYEWVEISPFEGGSGTRINFPFSTDDDAVVILLPFPLHYYGQSFNYALVSINGFIAFDTTRYDMQGHHWPSFDNNQIPEPSAPDGIIAPFWDDLEYTGNNGVFRYYDTANHRYIIEWKNCTHPNAPGNHPETFQLIINDAAFYTTPTGDCELIFQYHTVYNDDTDTWHPESPGLYCTVGIQNLQNNDGLLYTYDNLYNPAAAPLAAERAIKVTTATGMAPPPELRYEPSAFIEHAQAGGIVLDTLNLWNDGLGTLVYNLRLIADNRLSADETDNNSNRADRQPIGYFEASDSKSAGRLEPFYPPVIAGQGGPDTYGYRWIDSDESGGPVYNWIDISGIGTPIYITSDDGYEGPIDIGFDFPLYGNAFSSLYIEANGLLTFDAGTEEWSNTEIPNAATPNNFVSMLWDDLSPQNAGEIYYYYDNANSRFIVSFINTPFYSGGGDLTFQAILYANGQIVFQYQALDPGTRGLNQCTVGIENSTGDDGLEIAYNSDYLHDALALEFIPPVHWMSANTTSGVIRSQTNDVVLLTFSAADLSEGTYTGHLAFDCNDPDEGSINIPITFTVGGSSGCHYVTGDINGNGVANGIDVTYGVSYFKGGNAPPIVCDCPGHGVLFAGGDVNGNCIFNGIDITYFVGYLKGGSPLAACADCPPAATTIPAPEAVPIRLTNPTTNPDKNQ
jgi:hypothetical protein